MAAFFSSSDHKLCLSIGSIVQLAPRTPIPYFNCSADALQPISANTKGPAMTYHLDPGLFLENGPTALSERARERRATSNAYLAFRAAEKIDPSAPDEIKLKSAA
jgi:hypothetical protein